MIVIRNQALSFDAHDLLGDVGRIQLPTLIVAAGAAIEIDRRAVTGIGAGDVEALAADANEGTTRYCLETPALDAPLGGVRSQR